MQGSELRIGGITPLTSIDYPGELAAVIYCQGCPWRCGYCHNGELLKAGATTAYRWSDLLSWLQSRRGLLDAVVFSGGEPTLQKTLPQAVARVRELGFKVGLHTAGIYPGRLQALLPQLDWVGLDLKALPEEYEVITRARNSGAAAWQSLSHLLASGVPYQLRLTQHPSLTTDASVQQLRQRLAALGTEPLVVQPCVTANCFDPALR